jgi:hypothetical protein
VDPAWCLVMVDDPWLWTPGKTSGFDVPGNVRPLATRETPGDETPGDEIPGDVRPLATRETPGDVVRRILATALLIPIIVTWDSWASPAGLLPLASGSSTGRRRRRPSRSSSATLTWALIKCNILQMNMILLSGWRWGLFPYHPGGECAGSENGNSYDCLRSVSSGVETSSAGQRVWRTQRKNDGTVTLLERNLTPEDWLKTSVQRRTRQFSLPWSPAHLWATVLRNRRGAVRNEYVPSYPTRARDPISSLIIIIMKITKLEAEPEECLRSCSGRSPR